MRVVSGVWEGLSSSSVSNKSHAVENNGEKGMYSVGFASHRLINGTKDKGRKPRACERKSFNISFNGPTSLSQCFRY